MGRKSIPVTTGKENSSFWFHENPEPRRRGLALSPGQVLWTPVSSYRTVTVPAGSPQTQKHHLSRWPETPQPQPETLFLAMRPPCFKFPDNPQPSPRRGSVYRCGVPASQLDSRAKLPCRLGKRTFLLVWPLLPSTSKPQFPSLPLGIIQGSPLFLV